MPTHRKLTLEEREEIRVLYKMGGWSYDKLAEKYSSSKSTIKRVIKAGTPEPPPPPIQIVKPPEERPQIEELGFIEHPILFRIDMMSKLQMDTNSLAVRGVNPAALYKLQLELHDQITELRKIAGELTGEENPEEIKMQFEQALISLPPIMRDQLAGIMGEIVGLDNVVPLEKKG